ncbi:hypothetical protein JOF29_007540 [Kribbella aluminosa]|uniref:Uncharacterized protein n=1 Tax=Kribbella aluminosa TaxID=416017 RepID=A0ABS4UXR1_9ACTN|nr:hypothetical protein [Kribbella aluminosa]
MSDPALRQFVERATGSSCHSAGSGWKMPTSVPSSRTSAGTAKSPLAAPYPRNRPPDRLIA